MTCQMPSIEVKNLVKIYPSNLAAMFKVIGRSSFKQSTSTESASARPAVDDVSISIQSGERLGIVGQNGAGKSSLLHMIAGTAKPTSGEILIDGHITSILTLGIGLKEELTGRENIYLDGELHGKSHEEIESTVEDIINFSELNTFIDMPVRTYSTGMKSRLAFSIISFLDPEILIIDEALSVGDAFFSTKATKRIKEICARGKIVILVSHGLEAIKSICNRCIWMHEGRVRMDGSPDEVCEAYLKFVRESDEKELLDKFKQHLVAESFAAGCQIAEIITSSGNDYSPRNLLMAEAPWRIVIKGQCGIKEALIQIDIQRLDGLQVFTGERALITDDRDNFVLTLRFQPALAYGIYKVQIKTVDKEKVLARRASIFELVMNNKPSGGRPALVMPYRISSEQVS